MRLKLAQKVKFPRTSFYRKILFEFSGPNGAPIQPKIRFFRKSMHGMHGVNYQKTMYGTFSDFMDKVTTASRLNIEQN